MEKNGDSSDCIVKTCIMYYAWNGDKRCAFQVFPGDMSDYETVVY